MVQQIFWILFLVYLGYLYVLAKKGTEEVTEDRPVWKLLLFIIVGGAVVIGGANISVNAATALAQAIGNIVGSNIFNILFVLGTSALITPIPYKPTFLIDGLIALAAGVLLWVATIRKKELNRPWGIVMLVGYAAYFVYLLIQA